MHINIRLPPKLHSLDQICLTFLVLWTKILSMDISVYTFFKESCWGFHTWKLPDTVAYSVKDQFQNHCWLEVESLPVASSDSPWRLPLGLKTVDSNPAPPSHPPPSRQQLLQNTTQQVNNYFLGHEICNFCGGECGPRQCSQYSDLLWDGMSGDRILLEVRFSTLIQTSPRASCTMGSGSLPRRWSGQGVALTTHPHLVARLKKEYSYTSTPPVCLHGLLNCELYLYHGSEYEDYSLCRCYFILFSLKKEAACLSEMLIPHLPNCTASQSTRLQP